MSSEKSKRKRRADSKKQNTWLWIESLGLIAIVIVVFFSILQNSKKQSAISPSQVGVSEIDVENAYQKYQQGAFILDVREPDEWAQGHIPKATLIPLGQLANRVGELPEGQEIVVVCRSGNRSRQGSEILMQAGFSQVESMSGGMNAWVAAGYPIEKGE